MHLLDSKKLILKLKRVSRRSIMGCCMVVQEDWRSILPGWIWKLLWKCKIKHFGK